MSSARISPTAHYTGHVWVRNSLSDPAFATREGAWLHQLLAPFNAGSRAIGGPTIDGMLLARHRLIDHRLEAAIASGAVGQVIEIAAGLSPRGWRMSREYPSLRYIEADLPTMIARKRDVLGRATRVGPGHETAEIDALRDDGPTSVAGLAERLDPTVGTAIITEGLVNYFPVAQTVGMWRRFRAALARFPAGLYLSDLTFGEDARDLPTRAFRAALGVFVRGGVYLDFPDDDAARRALGESGFGAVTVQRPADFVDAIGEIEEVGARRVRILEAWLA